jgi:hypothetical protein
LASKWRVVFRLGQFPFRNIEKDEG